MTNNLNSPPAFPLSTIDGFSCDGMSLRDYFAAKALQGMLSNGHSLTARESEEGQTVGEVMAKRVYAFADAMLKERMKENDQ